MRFIKSITTCMFLIGFSLSSCSTGNYNPNSSSDTQGSTQAVSHVHTFSDKWSYDETYHWHATTCEHTSEVKDKSEHTFGGWVIDLQPTEESKGSRHRICTICRYRADETIPVLDHVHNWNDPTYTWSLGYDSCTAKRTCSINLYHVENETVDSTYSVITQPTTDSVGMGRYTAKFNNPAFKTQYKDVTIPKTNIAVTGISLSDETLELSVGSYSSLVATVSPYNATNTSIKWTTSNDKVATVSSFGLVTAISDGNAIITATTVDGGFSATCSVTVTHVPVTGVSLGSTALVLEEGKSESIYASVSPYTASNTNVAWSIDNNNVATISTTITGGCNITAVKSGTAIVTATTIDGGFTASCAITVIEKKNFSYLVGDAVVEIYSYSSKTRVKVYTPVTNNGNVNIYIGSCSIDIEDTNGNLKQKVDYIDCYPDLIRPGETTYVYDDVSYSGDVTTGLVGIPHITIKDASTANATRYTISDVSFIDDSLSSFKASGSVTNNTELSSKLITVSIIVFDKDGKYYATLYTYIYDDLASGASANFTASNLSLMYHKGEFTKDDIGSYKAYACEQEFVF